MKQTIDSSNDVDSGKSPLPTRHGFRFSLRSFLAALVVIGGVMGYLGNRLMVPDLPIRWDPNTGQNILWDVPLGSQTYSNPTAYGDYIFVGSNNGNGYDPLLPPDVDLGVMLCFEKRTGKFRWQHANRKLATGRVQDWPLQGVSSQAFADRDRVWYLSNRCEVVCLDSEGFYDGENDGPFVEELQCRPIDADVVWVVDLIATFGVFPHNISHCNVVVDDDHVYLKTSNGVDETHTHLPAPEAPSFVVLDRHTGNTIWTDNTPRHIFHGSWGSPTLATIRGKRQVLFPGGDGWLYSFEPGGDGTGNSTLLWKFDCNPKTSEFKLGGRGERNNLLTAPTVHRNHVYITMGQDPEHGEGLSRVWCIDPGTRRGDISPTVVNKAPGSPEPALDNGYRFCCPEYGDSEISNPNSGLVWEYRGVDTNGNSKIDRQDNPFMCRSLSTVRPMGDQLFVTDLYGILHCIDADTGQLNWHYDLFASVWVSPLVTRDYVYVFDEDGQTTVLKTKQDLTLSNPTPVAQNLCPGDTSIYSNPAIDADVIYVVSRQRLIALKKTVDDTGR